LVVTDRPEGRLGLLADDLVAVPGDLSRLLRRVAAGAPWDVVVLDVEDAGVRRSLLLQVAFAVRRGGQLLVGQARAGVTGPEDSVLRLVAEVSDHAEGERAPNGLRSYDLPPLRAAWREVELRGPHLALRNDLDAYVKVAEADMNELLELRPERGRLLTTVPGRSFEPTAEVRESDSPLAGSWTRSYDVPSVSLREYADVVCHPGQVVLQGASALPDTFRHAVRVRARNTYAPPLGPHFVRVRESRPAERTLEGPHFYWDSEFRGHFGHVMTEMLSRLWALDEARRHHPDLKILMAMNKDRGLGSHEVAVLEAFGTTREEITFVNGPVRVPTLLAATPMFSQPDYVHPRIVEVWDRLGEHLAGRAPQRDYPRRFFVARRIEKRPCRNAAEVEQLFAARGFEIVYPEDYPLAEQARMFREAETIAGFAGSGLFNLLLVDRPTHLIMVSSESYTAENEWMIAAVRGHRVDVVWCEAEIKMKKEQWVREAFHSPYWFNADREGVFLRRILAELPD